MAQKKNRAAYHGFLLPFERKGTFDLEQRTRQTKDGGTKWFKSHKRRDRRRKQNTMLHFSKKDVWFHNWSKRGGDSHKSIAYLPKDVYERDMGIQKMRRKRK